MSARRLEIHGREVGPFAENSYVLACAATKACVLIDPGEAEPVLDIVREEGYTPLAIYNTHGHIDHVAGVAEVQDALGIPFYLHPADEQLVRMVPQQAAMFGLAPPPLPRIDHSLAAGQMLRVGELVLEVRHVPGHSPGHVVFVVGDVVFGGDCLFAGSIGRTDIPGGNHRQLLTSIASQLLTLSDDTVVYPGHGPATSIGRERATNPFLSGHAG